MTGPEGKRLILSLPWQCPAASSEGTEAVHDTAWIVEPAGDNSARGIVNGALGSSTSRGGGGGGGGVEGSEGTVGAGPGNSESSRSGDAETEVPGVASSKNRCGKVVAVFWDVKRVFRSPSRLRPRQWRHYGVRYDRDINSTFWRKKRFLGDGAP